MSVIRVVSPVSSIITVAGSNPVGWRNAVTEIRVIATEALSAFQVASFFDGEASLADNTDTGVEDSRLGLVTADAEIDEYVTLWLAGRITNPAWNWVEGQIYLSTAGTLTQTEPAVGVVILVGWALSDTEIILSLDQLQIDSTNLTASKTSKLSITGSKAASSVYSVTSSGVSYTHSGDDGDLLSSASLFNNAENIKIFLNGTYQGKGDHAVWQSAASFTLDQAVDNGDEIIILS